MVEMKPGMMNTKSPLASKSESQRDPRIGTSVGQLPPPRSVRALRVDRAQRSVWNFGTRAGESTDIQPRSSKISRYPVEHWIRKNASSQMQSPHAIVRRQLQDQGPSQPFVPPVWREMMGLDRVTLLSQARELFGDRLAEVILTHDVKHFDGLDVVAARTSEADLRPLASAVRIADRLREVAGTDTIQAWFVGTNPLLNDEEPAIVIKTDPGAVWNAAKHFIAYA